MERPNTPDRPIRRQEATTRKRTRFFTLYDMRGPTNTVVDLAKQEGISRQTAYNWLKQRSKNGDLAFRRPGKQRIGRPLKLSDEQLDFLIEQELNPMISRKLDHQAAWHELDVTGRTLRDNLRKRTGAGRYCQRLVANLEPSQMQTRVNWAKRLEVGNYRLVLAIRMLYR